MDPDPASHQPHRIPPIAWVAALASIALAAVTVMVVPGPAMEGCLHAKGCFPLPKAPLLAAGGVLLLGAALATLLGRIPRHWIVGWSVAMAGMATMVLAVVPLAIGTAPLYSSVRPIGGGPARYSDFELAFTLGTGSLLTFVVLSVALAVVGLLVGVLVPEPELEPLPEEHERDGRPHWQRQLEAVHAALDGGPRPLSSSESLLVAELAYQVDNGELEVPASLTTLGAQLLDLLSRDGAGVRDRVLGLLRRAMDQGGDRIGPYRAC